MLRKPIISLIFLKASFISFILTGPRSATVQHFYCGFKSHKLHQKELLVWYHYSEFEPPYPGCDPLYMYKYLIFCHYILWVWMLITLLQIPANHRDHPRKQTLLMCALHKSSISDILHSPTAANSSLRTKSGRKTFSVETINSETSLFLNSLPDKLNSTVAGPKAKVCLEHLLQSCRFDLP